MSQTTHVHEDPNQQQDQAEWVHQERRKPIRWRRLIGLGALLFFLLGFLIPDPMKIPVEGATPGDWNPKSFWYAPWGRSGVHKGIDIFARRGQIIRAPSPGLVISRGNGDLGGHTLLVLGPKWRLHYYAHLNEPGIAAGSFVGTGDVLGYVGTSGNAAGKQPHLHYSLVTSIPYIWRIRGGPQGYKRIFFLDPGQWFASRPEGSP